MEKHYESEHSPETGKTAKFYVKFFCMNGHEDVNSDPSTDVKSREGWCALRGFRSKRLSGAHLPGSLFKC